MQEEFHRNFGSTSSHMPTPWVLIFVGGLKSLLSRFLFFRYGVPVGNNLTIL